MISWVTAMKGKKSQRLSLRKKRQGKKKSTRGRSFQRRQQKTPRLSSERLTTDLRAPGVGGGGGGGGKGGGGGVLGWGVVVSVGGVVGFWEMFLFFLLGGWVGGGEGGGGWGGFIAPSRETPIN